MSMSTICAGKTGILAFWPRRLHPEAIARGVQLLREGKLVAFPTETVYGLGADAGNPRAVRAIFAAKGRPADHPVIVHVHDAAHAAHWARRDAGRRPSARRSVLARPADDDPAARDARDRRPSPAARTASACACPRIRSRRRCCAASRRPAVPASPRRRRIASAASRRRPRSTSPTTSASAVALDPRRRRVRRRHREHDRRVRRRASRCCCVRAVSPPQTLARRARPDAARSVRRRAARVGHARLALRAAHAVAHGRGAASFRAIRRQRRRAGAHRDASGALARVALDRRAGRCRRLRARPVREPARARCCRRRDAPDRSRPRPMPRGTRCATASRARRTATTTTGTRMPLRMPRVVLAPDSFKGSLSAPEVCAALARGLTRAMPAGRDSRPADGRRRRRHARRRAFRGRQRRAA